MGEEDDDDNREEKETVNSNDDCIMSKHRMSTLMLIDRFPSQKRRDEVEGTRVNVFGLRKNAGQPGNP